MIFSKYLTYSVRFLQILQHLAATFIEYCDLLGTAPKGGHQYGEQYLRIDRKKTELSP
jgi:hypothetical protein